MIAKIFLSLAAELIPVRSLKIIFFQRDPNSILFRQLTGNGSKNYDVPNPRYMKHGIINGNEGFKTLLKINLITRIIFISKSILLLYYYMYHIKGAINGRL